MPNKIVKPKSTASYSCSLRRSEHSMFFSLDAARKVPSTRGDCPQAHAGASLLLHMTNVTVAEFLEHLAHCRIDAAKVVLHVQQIVLRTISFESNAEPTISVLVVVTLDDASMVHSSCSRSATRRCLRDTCDPLAVFVSESGGRWRRGRRWNLQLRLCVCCSDSLPLPLDPVRQVRRDHRQNASGGASLT